MTWALNSSPIKHAHSQTRFFYMHIKLYQAQSILQSFSEHVTWKIKQYFIFFANHTIKHNGMGSQTRKVRSSPSHHKPSKLSGTAKFPISRSTQMEAEESPSYYLQSVPIFLKQDWDFFMGTWRGIIKSYVKITISKPIKAQPWRPDQTLHSWWNSMKQQSVQKPFQRTRATTLSF